MRVYFRQIIMNTIYEVVFCLLSLAQGKLLFYLNGVFITAQVSL